MPLLNSGVTRPIRFNSMLKFLEPLLIDLGYQYQHQFRQYFYEANKITESRKLNIAAL